MKIQLHWQGRDNPSDTILVAQRFVADEYDEKNNTKDDLDWHDWSVELITRRRGEAPDGWWPLICTQTYSGFVQGKEDGEF